MKMKLLVLSLVSFFSVSAYAGTVQIKLGTLAPAGSPWYVELKQAAQQSEAAAKNWSAQHPDQPIDLKFVIYGDGKLGDEAALLAKMRIGTIQAAGMSTIGMHQITPEPQALDIPLLVQTNEERAYLLEKMAPELETALANKGYVVLTWSEVGFTHFYATQPRPTLDEMRKAKLFSWEDDPASTEAWKVGGFHPVVLSSTDMVTSLQTGMIDAILYPPTVVLAIRAYEKANYMMDIKWSTLTAATILKKDTWEKLPEGLRPIILNIFHEGAKRISMKAREMEEDATKKMESLGLKIVKVTDRPAWDAMSKDIYKVISGKVVPKATFDKVMQIVAEYRAKHGK